MEIHKVTEGGHGKYWKMSLFEQLTSLDGRINRLRYFVLHFVTLIITIIYAAIIGIFLGLLWAITGAPEVIVDIIFGLFMIPLVYIVYAIILKRLQDMSRDGPWVTYLQVYSVLSILYFMVPYGSYIESTIDLVTIIMSIPLGIVCLFFKGDHGPNRYGPDPLREFGADSIM